MPIGPILLSILWVLTYFGLLDGALRRLRLAERVALLLLTAMLLGSLVEVNLAPGLRINLGSGLLPLAAAGYLVGTSGEVGEPGRAIAAAAVTAFSVYLMGRWFPPGLPTELNLFALDAQYLYGLVGGLTGCALGRTRRGAFFAAVAGVALADLIHYATFRLSAMAPRTLIEIGGGGFWGTAVVAGVLAVLLVELLGETRAPVKG